ncbi:MAG: ABC transporter ATP-binding protein [bacterium]|nr:ABC transporter ATP-binding protein [bacterium]
MTAAPLLSAHEIEKSYVGSRVLTAVSIDVAPGRITALIGPNGAGKTTLFDIVTGFIRADVGRVHYQGRDITKLPAFRRAREGIIKTFQIPHQFDSLTVEENLLVAAGGQIGERFPAGLWALGAIARQEAEQRARAVEIMEFLGLRARRDISAGELSAGEKKLLELARALMLRPKLLMLDEPLAGVPAGVGRRILEHLVELRDRGMTLLVVEHNLEAIMRIANWAYVLVDGRLLASGEPASVQHDQAVQAAYLGDG